MIKNDFPYMSLMKFDTEVLCSCMRVFKLTDYVRPSLLKQALQAHTESASHKEKVEKSIRRSGGVKRKTITLEEMMKNAKTRTEDFCRAPRDDVVGQH